MSDLRIAPTSLPPLPSTPALRREDSAGTTGFGEALGRALETVNGLQLEAQKAGSALAAGDRVDMTQTLVTVEKANVSFQFALQIRNKLLEAYQEIMRMTV
jgi:flagellar hook-basal body complex protein FliE